MGSALAAFIILTPAVVGATDDPQPYGSATEAYRQGATAMKTGEMSAAVLPTLPLHTCGADSQGGMGYMIQQVLGNDSLVAMASSRIPTLYSLDVYSQGTIQSLRSFFIFLSFDMFSKFK